MSGGAALSLMENTREGTAATFAKTATAATAAKGGDRFANFFWPLFFVPSSSA
jgi:hypothetical protein